MERALRCGGRLGASSGGRPGSCPGEWCLCRESSSGALSPAPVPGAAAAPAAARGRLYRLQPLLALGHALAALALLVGDLLGGQRQPLDARRRLGLAEQVVQQLGRRLLLLPLLCGGQRGLVSGTSITQKRVAGTKKLLGKTVLNESSTCHNSDTVCSIRLMKLDSRKSLHSLPYHLFRFREFYHECGVFLTFARNMHSRVRFFVFFKTKEAWTIHEIRDSFTPLHDA